MSVGFKNGKPVRKVFTAATRGEVQQKLVKAVCDLQLGIPLADERLTLSAHIEAWLRDVVKSNVRPKTFRTYDDLVRIHIKPALGTKSIAKLSPQIVRTFLNEKLESGLSPATVKHLLVLLRTAMKSAVTDGLIPRNVAALVASPKRRSGPDALPEKAKGIQTFDTNQARAFLDAIKDDRLEALFTVAVSLGMRQGEILGLTWASVDMEACRLSVAAQLQRIEGKLVLVTPKSAKSVRGISLPAVAVSALHAHRYRPAQEREWSGSDWQESGFVFTTSRGTPMDPRNVIQKFHAALKMAG